jgi:ribose 5-phosphate isomerase B
MARLLVTEETIRDLLQKGGKDLRIPKGSLITPLAQELASTSSISITVVPDAPPQGSISKTPETHSDEHAGMSGIVAFGSDHSGFQYKETLRKFAESLGYRTLDLGTYNQDMCDYPDFAYAVAKAVAEGRAYRGVMIDGAGIGSSVVANKVPGVRAACCHNEFVARNAREHNDTNVLTLGSRVLGIELCKEILRIWLESWFAGGRHKLRVEKITQMERRFLR